VQPDELPAIEVEVSVLTPPAPSPIRLRSSSDVMA
jgi:AMMECR1 domain-containing protein